MSTPNKKGEQPKRKHEIPVMHDTGDAPATSPEMRKFVEDKLAALNIKPEIIALFVSRMK
jgi:hypothetical protein